MKLSLFWRTFLLLSLSTLVSIVLTLQLFHWFNRAPAEQQIAWELASVVNLTRSALINSSGDKRRALLMALAKEERASVTLLEITDQVEPAPTSIAGIRIDEIEDRLQKLLGSKTALSYAVNGEQGVWISFDIDGDGYWLRLDRQRLKRNEPPSYWTISAVALLLSFIATVLLGQVINQPLRSLASAVKSLGAGDRPARLSESGPTEIATLNQGFNQMASDLLQLEEDRRIALAGISHDVRSPLTRLRMEIELCRLSEEEKLSMSSEIEQVDRIVGQFVEFARAPDQPSQANLEILDVNLEMNLCREQYKSYIERGDLALSIDVKPGLQWRGRQLDLQRMLSNAIDNALRYGRLPNGQAQVRIDAKSLGQARTDLKNNASIQSTPISLQISDSGQGVPDQDLERLLRPFARVDAERSSQGGSGLGLAIIDRTARRYAGKCELFNAIDADYPGLTIRLTLPG